MRNLAQYPVTTKEVLKVIDEIIKDFDPNLIGDVRPYVMVLVKELVKKHGIVDLVSKGL